MKMTPEQNQRLTKAQNNPYNHNQDIITFTTFLDTNEELERHINLYETLADEFNKLSEKLKRQVLKGKISLPEASLL